MKTSNLIALMIALLITAGGFAGINFLFTTAATANDRSQVELAERA